MRKLLLSFILAITTAQAGQPIGAGGKVLVPADFSSLTAITNLASTNLIVLWIGGTGTNATNVAMTYATFQALVTSGVSGGATINPTDGYSPYRSNSTTFGDGPWYHIQADALGFVSTNWAFVINPTNVLVGDRTYTVTSGALWNSAFGVNALQGLTSGDFNSAFGYEALSAMTTASLNTAVGYGAGRVATGSGGTFLGYNAGRQVTSGFGNTIVGEAAGDSLTSGTRNAYFGGEAAYYNTSDDGTAIGFQAGGIAANLTRAVFIGSQAIAANERVDKNFTDTIHIGYKASTQTNNTQTITNSIYIGPNLLPASPNVIVIGNSSQSTLTVGNVIRTPSTTSFAVGQAASGSSSAANLTAVGYNASTANTSGSGNTAIGASALETNQDGNDNVAVGYQSLQTENSGYYNVAVGRLALGVATGGDANVGIGYKALDAVTSGQYNVGVGTESGINGDGTGAANLITGSRNTHIGYRTGASATNVNDEIVIGYAAVGKGANTAVIGYTTTTKVYMGGGSASIVVGSNPPATASSSGVAGTITWDSSFIYVCVAANTWKRVGISTW